MHQFTEGPKISIALDTCAPLSNGITAVLERWMITVTPPEAPDSEDKSTVNLAALTVDAATIKQEEVS